MQPERLTKKALLGVDRPLKIKPLQGQLRTPDKRLSEKG